MKECKFLKKITKGFGITTIAFGTGLACVGAGLLGCGTNKIAYINQTADGVDYTIKIPVGSLNYKDKMSASYSKNGNSISATDSDAAKAVAKVQEVEKYFTESVNISKIGPKKAVEEIKKQANELRDSADYKAKKQALSAAQEALKNNNDDSKFGQLSQAVKDAENALADDNWGLMIGNTVIESYESGHAMMVSGAILFTVFTLVAALGIVITILKIKMDKKQAQ